MRPIDNLIDMGALPSVLNEIIENEGQLYSLPLRIGMSRKYLYQLPLL